MASWPIAWEISFFGSYSAKVSESAVLRIRGAHDRVTKVAVMPLHVFNPVVVFRPVPLESARAQRVGRFLLGASIEHDGLFLRRSLPIAKRRAMQLEQR